MCLDNTDAMSPGPMRTRTVQLLLRNKILYLWGGVRAYRAGPDLDRIYMSSSR